MLYANDKYEFNKVYNTHEEHLIVILLQCKIFLIDQLLTFISYYITLYSRYEIVTRVNSVLSTGLAKVKSSAVGFFMSLLFLTSYVNLSPIFTSLIMYLKIYLFISSFTHSLFFTYLCYNFFIHHLIVSLWLGSTIHQYIHCYDLLPNYTGKRN